MSIDHYVHNLDGVTHLTDPGDVGSFNVEPGEVRVSLPDGGYHWHYAVAARSPLDHHENADGSLDIVVAAAPVRRYAAGEWSAVEFSKHGDHWQNEDDYGPGGR